MFKNKKFIACAVAIVLSAMAVIPYITFGAGNDDTDQYTWTAEFEEKALAKGMTPTGLRIRQTPYGPWNGSFAFGTKTYFDDRSGSAKEEFKDFVGNYFFCVGKHANAQPLMSWSQAFNDGQYMAYPNDQLPPAGVMSMNAATTEELRKFNFLMIVFTSAMLGDQSTSECESEVNTTSQFAVAATVNWAACDEGLFKGNSVEEDWNAYVGAGYYNSIVNEFSSNKSSQVPYNEIVAFAKTWFTEIWNTAKSAMSMEVDTTTEDTILRGKLVQKDDSYYVVIPYPGYTVDESGTITATTGANESICANWSTVKANNLQGDWVFEGAHDNAVWFKSPTGEIESESFATIYWDGEGSQMAMTGKDFTTWMNIGAAKLYTFQCARPVANDWVFWETQTFFAADFATKKDIVVKIGDSVIPGGDSAEVTRYKHDEMFLSHYNVNLIKYDSETGEPLSGAQFDILEKDTLDDQSAYTDTDLDKSVHGTLNGTGTFIQTEWDEGDPHDSLEENYTGYSDSALVSSEVTKYNWANDNGYKFANMLYSNGNHAIDYVIGEYGTFIQIR